jgi:phenylalanyl-tRNA synthetase beta chain
MMQSIGDCRDHGWLDSSVTDDTQDIFLESAFFAPLAIAGRARRFGLHTDSSQRYERGVDFELPMIAMHRASQLIQQLQVESLVQLQ